MEWSRKKKKNIGKKEVNALNQRTQKQEKKIFTENGKRGMTGETQQEYKKLSNRDITTHLHE